MSGSVVNPRGPNPVLFDDDDPDDRGLHARGDERAVVGRDDVEDQQVVARGGRHGDRQHDIGGDRGASPAGSSTRALAAGDIAPSVSESQRPTSVAPTPGSPWTGPRSSTVGPWPQALRPRLTTPTGSSASLPAASLAVGATRIAPSGSPVTRTTRLGISAWVAASYATPSPSWSVIVRRYRPGALGRTTGIDRYFEPSFSFAGATTSPIRSGVTRARSGAAGVAGRISGVAVGLGVAVGAAGSVATAGSASATSGSARTGSGAARVAAGDGLASTSMPGIGGSTGTSSTGTSVAGSVGTSGTSSGSQRTLAWTDFGRSLRSLILNRIRSVALPGGRGQALEGRRAEADASLEQVRRAGHDRPSAAARGPAGAGQDIGGGEARAQHDRAFEAGRHARPGPSGPRIRGSALLSNAKT